MAKTAALTSVMYAPTPFGDRYRQETSVGIYASFPAIEFTSDWAPVVRGSHHSGQYCATFNDWTSEAVEAPVRISVWRRINSGQSEMLYEYESTATYAPSGSFTMEGCGIFPAGSHHAAPTLVKGPRYGCNTSGRAGRPRRLPSSLLKKAIVAIVNVGHATTSGRRASQTSDLGIACLRETSCFA